MYLTGKQLVEVLEFLGINIDNKDYEDQLETEMCIRKGDIYDGDELIYQDGLICYYAEYPEEGSIGLEENKFVKRT